MIISRFQSTSNQIPPFFFFFNLIFDNFFLNFEKVNYTKKKKKTYEKVNYPDASPNIHYAYAPVFSLSCFPLLLVFLIHFTWNLNVCDSKIFS